MRADVGLRGWWPLAGFALPVWALINTLALCGAVLSCPAWAETSTTRVSVGSGGLQGTADSARPALSADGRFVAFQSRAVNLITGDTNGVEDIFVYDRLTGITERASISSTGLQGTSDSRGPAISADGRFVAFYSGASNLVAADTNATVDVFVHDRLTGITERISVGPDGVQGNDQSTQPAISADGRFVVFQSHASTLVIGDTNAVLDVFVHDRVTHITTRASVGPAGVQGNDHSFGEAVSADGRFVAFHSYATNLVDGDTNAVSDVFLHDRLTGFTTRVSVGAGGVQGNHGSTGVALSADGRFVTFDSSATNLVFADSNLKVDVFVHDRMTGATTRVSVGSGATQSNGDSGHGAVSADGRFVAFGSLASTLVTGDANGCQDVFLHDRVTGTTTRVSVGPGGMEGNNASVSPAISADGRFVAFESVANTLVTGDTNGMQDVFVHDRQAGITATTLVTVGPAGVQGNGDSEEPAVSADGRFVAFASEANNLVTGQSTHNHVFVHDRRTGITTRVSVSSAGVQANGYSLLPALSADGRFVAFVSTASNLVTEDTNAVPDVFVHDREAATTTRVSVGPGGVQGNGHSSAPVLSADGRFVAFNSGASNLVVGDTNGYSDVFVHDRLTDATERVSVGSGGVEGNAHSFAPALSADGRFVAFDSGASNLVTGDTNDYQDVFVRDRHAGTTIRVSLGPGGVEGSGDSCDPVLSADGRFVAFASDAHLVSGETNWWRDIFVHDRVTGTTTRVSVGAGGVEGNGESNYPAISVDGRFVAFESEASTLVSGDTNAAADVFMHDRVTGITTRVSVGPEAVQGNGASTHPSVTADGRLIAFDSLASTLVTWDSNGHKDVFVQDLGPAVQPADDDDGDGISNADEFANGTDPTAAELYFAEGSLTGVGAGHFETRFSIFNPNPVLSAQVTLRFQVEGGGEITDTLLLGPLERRSIDTSLSYPALQMYSGFSTVIEGRLVGATTGPRYNIVAERTMTWQRGGLNDGYASHAETAVRQPATRWYLAEGATFGAFQLYYLLQNPNPVAAQVSIRYFFASGLPCMVGVPVPALARKTLFINAEVSRWCGRNGTDVSALITASQPLIVERAMYLDDGPGGRPVYYAGHESAGVLQPQHSWRFAEGATGAFFDTYLLVLNQEPVALDIRLTFLRQGRPNVSVDRRIPANSRNTFALDVLRQYGTGNGQSGAYVVPAEGGVSTIIDVLSPGGTVIAERAMWWPGPLSGATGPGNPQPLWEEAHVSAGATLTSTLWTVADAEAQGEALAQTYVLISNTSAVATRARVTLAFTDALGAVTTRVRDFCVAPLARETLEFPSPPSAKYTDPTPSTCGRTAIDDFAGVFTDATVQKRFSVMIESFGVEGQVPGNLVVERAQYGRDVPADTAWGGVAGPYWPAGSNNLATPLRR